MFFSHPSSPAVKILKAYKFSLAEIKEILSECEDEMDMLNHLKSKLVEIRGKIHRYKEISREKDELLASTVPPLGFRFKSTITVNSDILNISSNSIFVIVGFTPHLLRQMAVSTVAADQSASTPMMCRCGANGVNRRVRH